MSNEGNIVAKIKGAFANVWPGYVIRYFSVQPQDGYIKLRVGTWYGYMESGKTFSDGVLEAKLKSRAPRLYVVTDNIVYAVHDLLSRRLDELRSYQYLDILFDDALIVAHSQEKRIVKVYTDKVVSTLRHIFATSLPPPRVITLRVATQKFTVLHPVLRNAPVIFFKSAPNDPGDYSALSRIAKKGGVGKRVFMSLLKDLTALEYVDDVWCGRSTSSSWRPAGSRS